MICPQTPYSLVLYTEMEIKVQREKQLSQGHGTRKWWSQNWVQVSFFSSKCLILATTAHDYPSRVYLEAWSIKNTLSGRLGGSNEHHLSDNINLFRIVRIYMISIQIWRIFTQDNKGHQAWLIIDILCIYLKEGFIKKHWKFANF